MPRAEAGLGMVEVSEEQSDRPLPFPLVSDDSASASAAFGTGTNTPSTNYSMAEDRSLSCSRSPGPADLQLPLEEGETKFNDRANPLTVPPVGSSQTKANVPVRASGWGVASSGSNFGAGNSPLSPLSAARQCQCPQTADDVEVFSTLKVEVEDRGATGTEGTVTAQKGPQGAVYDWHSTPLVTGPLYFKCGAVFQLAKHCALTKGQLTCQIDDTVCLQLSVSTIVDVKLIEFLHFYENYVFEVVVRDTTDSNAAIQQSNAMASGSLSSPTELFRSLSERSPLWNTQGTGNGLDSPPTDPSSPLPARSNKKCVVDKPDRLSVSKEGHPGGEEFAVLTFRAFSLATLSDWVDGLQSISHGSISPSERPVVHDVDELTRGARPQVPVYGQGFYKYTQEDGKRGVTA